MDRLRAAPDILSLTFIVPLFPLWTGWIAVLVFLAPFLFHPAPPQALATVRGRAAAEADARLQPVTSPGV